MPLLNFGQQTKSKVIDITPDKSIFYKIAKAGYSTPEAIAELVDNSIDARIDGKELRIEIQINKDYIDIYDNASGMDSDTLHNAFRLGHSIKEGKIGQFGVGMKSAGLSLGSQITVETSPFNDPKIYKVTYNNEEWKSSGNEWVLNLEEIDNGNTHNHYTRVRITGIQKYYSNIVTILKNDLGKRYYPLLKANNLQIKVNNKFCKAIEPILEDGTKEEFSFSTNEGQKVHGWYGLLVESSQKGEYGFTTYHKGRMITTFDKIGFTPHATVARIIGEIHMDHVPVTTSKREFEKESKEYKEVINKLEEVMYEFVQRTKKLSKKDRISSHVIKKVEEYINQITDILNDPQFEEYTLQLQPTLYKPDLDGSDEQEVEIEKREKKTKESEEEIEPKDERKREPKSKQERIRNSIKIQGKRMEFEHEFQNLGENGPWKAWEISEEDNVINIITNLDFRMSDLIRDQSVVALHSIAEALAEVFVSKSFNNDHERVIQIKEEIMRRVVDPALLK